MTITFHCPGCQSDALVRNGHAPNGKQVYRCRACGRQSRENPTPNAYRQARRDEILHVYQERSSLRGLTRTDCGSHAHPSPVGSKKSSSASPLPHDLGGPRPRGCRFHHPGTLSTVVVCPQKSQRLLDLARPVPTRRSTASLRGYRFPASTVVFFSR